MDWACRVDGDKVYTISDIQKVTWTGHVEWMEIKYTKCRLGNILEASAEKWKRKETVLGLISGK
jgi:hypothetical protein